MERERTVLRTDGTVQRNNKKQQQGGTGPRGVAPMEREDKLNI